jgi:tetratricopeptide (TPR) repeat protein
VSEDKKTIVKMAHIYTQEGRWDKAVSEYKKLLKLDPEDFNTYSVLGDAYLKKGELQPAFDAYLVCSDAYVRLGQLEKAALAQSKIARLDPSQLNEPSKAKQAVFQKQVEGDKAMDAGEFDKAIQAYQDVLKLDRDRFDLYQKLGDLYLRKGETEAACAKYLEIGNIYFTNKLYKKAAPIFLKVVELDPEQVDAHAALAEIQAKSGNESEAKKELITLTEFLFQRGDYDRAYQFALRAEQLKAIESYNYIGHVLLRRGKADEAKTWFEKLLKFKLNHAGALWGMGLWYLEKGQFDEAVKSMAKVPSTERFYGETQVSLGSVYEKMGKPDDAITAYQTGAAALRKKGLVEPAKVAEAKVESLGGVVGAALAPAAVAPGLSQVEAPQPLAPEPEPEAVVAAPAPAPVPLEAPAPPVPAAVSAPPPLPVLAEPVAAPLPPLPVMAPAESFAPSAEPDEEIATLVALAESQEEEGDYDGALSLYQSIIDQFPQDPRGKQGLARVYSKVGQGAVAAKPVPAGPSADELAHLAALKAAAEAEQAKAAAEAKRQAEERALAEANAQKAAEARAKAELEAQRLANEKSSAEAAAKALAETEARLRAETEARLRSEIEARQKAEAEAKAQADQAAAAVDDMRKRLEAEIRQQLEAQMRREMEEQMQRSAEEGVRKKVEEARLQAEAEAKRSAEDEIRRQFEEERKKLENQKADEKRRLEDELRQRLTAEIQQKKDQEAQVIVREVRAREEEQSRQKIQSEVLARVQAQQKEKMAPLQRTIEEIRRKVEEQQAANAASAPSVQAPVPVPAPAAPASVKAADDELDDMDPFMNAAVADIYVKQGLVKEAVRIYEKILKLDPANAEIRGKLDVVLGRPAPAETKAKTSPSADPAAPAPAPGPAAPKKSKVSYL